jgi:hypothetical protein
VTRVALLVAVDGFGQQLVRRPRVGRRHRHRGNRSIPRAGTPARAGSPPGHRLQRNRRRGQQQQDEHDPAVWHPALGTTYLSLATLAIPMEWRSSSRPRRRCRAEEFGQSCRFAIAAHPARLSVTLHSHHRSAFTPG